MQNKLLRKRVEQENVSSSVTAKADHYMNMGDVHRIAKELMPVLNPGLPFPEFKIVNTPRSRWLGQCKWKYGLKMGQPFYDPNTVIEVQKSVMVDETSLKRILAHELCHHQVFLDIDGPNLVKLGYYTFKMMYGRKDGHGADFMAVASRFNAKYGADFVSRTSDENVVVDADIKPYFIFIMATNGLVPGQKLFYQVSGRLSPKQQQFVLGRGFLSHRLTKTDDPSFIKGCRIGGQWSYIPKSSPNYEERMRKLAELFNSPDIRTTEWGIKPVSMDSFRKQPEELSNDELYNELSSGYGKSQPADSGESV